MNCYRSPQGLYRSPRTSAAVLLGIFLSFGSQAQSFQNLDFENAGAIATDGIWLNWSLAVPNWTHPKGGDSLFVYHRSPPLYSIAQFYFLVDNTSTRWSPLEGNRSLALVSGHFNRNEASSPWVQAYIAQEGWVPENAKSFHLLATGDFSLSIDEMPVPVSRVSGNEYLADVSAYAGQYVSLKVASEALEVQSPVIVDHMGFSTQTVPEPGSSTLLLLGLAAFGIRQLRRKR
jgi:hypothetical protein